MPLGSDAAFGFAEIGGVARTTDGGATWENDGPGEWGTCVLEFVDSDLGWVVGWNGEIYRSLDGGVTWEAQAFGTTERLLDVRFVDALVGTAVGDNGTILRRETGGEAAVAIEGAGCVLPPALRSDGGLREASSARTVTGRGTGAESCRAASGSCPRRG